MTTLLQTVLLLITIIANVIMDAVVFYNAFGKYGIWFSSEGWKCKYILADWLNKYLPMWLSRFLALNVLVMFTDLFHLSKSVMIYTFMVLIFGFTWKAFTIFIIWGGLFSWYLSFYSKK
jgi:hypothetical protein